MRKNMRELLVLANNILKRQIKYNTPTDVYKALDRYIDNAPKEDVILMVLWIFSREPELFDIYLKRSAKPDYFRIYINLMRDEILSFFRGGIIDTDSKAQKKPPYARTFKTKEDFIIFALTVYEMQLTEAKQVAFLKNLQVIENSQK